MNQELGYVDIAIDGATLALSGDFDVRSTFAVRTALHDLLAVHQHVVVDLSGVVSVDVTALKVLAAASFQGSRDGRHVTLQGCGGPVIRMLHLTHLMKLVDVDRDAVPA